MNLTSDSINNLHDQIENIFCGHQFAIGNQMILYYAINNRYKYKICTINTENIKDVHIYWDGEKVKYNWRKYIYKQLKKEYTSFFEYLLKHIESYYYLLIEILDIVYNDTSKYRDKIITFVNNQDKDGDTIIHKTIEYLHIYRYNKYIMDKLDIIFKKLIKFNNHNPTLKGSYGNTVLLEICCNNFLKLTYMQLYIDNIKNIKNGIDCLNVCNDEHVTPLTIILGLKDIKYIKMLAECNHEKHKTIIDNIEVCDDKMLNFFVHNKVIDWNINKYNIQYIIDHNYINIFKTIIELNEQEYYDRKIDYEREYIFKDNTKTTVSANIIDYIYTSKYYYEYRWFLKFIINKIEHEEVDINVLKKLIDRNDQVRKKSLLDKLLEMLQYNNRIPSNYKMINQLENEIDYFININIKYKGKIYTFNIFDTPYYNTCALRHIKQHQILKLLDRYMTINTIYTNKDNIIICNITRIYSMIYNHNIIHKTQYKNIKNFFKNVVNKILTIKYYHIFLCCNMFRNNTFLPPEIMFTIYNYCIKIKYE